MMKIGRDFENGVGFYAKESFSKKIVSKNKKTQIFSINLSWVAEIIPMKRELKVAIDFGIENKVKLQR